MLRTAIWALAAVGCCLACMNVAVLLVAGSYDVHVGPVHLVAHEVFKPFLIVGFAFWVAVFLRGTMPQAGRAADQRPTSHWAVVLAIAAYGCVSIYSAGVNYLDSDWAATGDTGLLHGLSGVVKTFTAAGLDGFYRPTLLLSLWFDRVVFGSALWAYHLQSILLHALNALLAYKFARELGVEAKAAFWGSAVFLLAASDFEPIMWPAARPDLFATAFILLTLIWFCKGELWLAAGAYVLGLLSKESAYCVPLLLAALAIYRGLSRTQMLRAGAIFGAITVAMLGVRIAIYGNLGGYPATIAGGESPHFTFGIKSVTGILTRVIPMPPMALNVSMRLSGAMACFVALYLAAIVWAVIGGAAIEKGERLLIAMALLSAAPMVNLIGWVGESMKHSRYLYLPGLWMIMAAAAVMARVRFGNVALALLVVANVAGSVHNIGVYRSVVGQAHAMARQVVHDAAERHASAVDLGGVDPEPYGVVLFRREIADLVRAERPEMCIEFEERSCGTAAPALKYQWPQR